jgi:hypothetical protein
MKMVDEGLRLRPPYAHTMLFNVDKCKIVYFGFNNTLASYQLNDINLVMDKEERDLGVIIQNDLKCTQHNGKIILAELRK